MEVDRSVVLRLLSGLRQCSQHVERGVTEHPLNEVDVGLLALAEAADGTLRPSQAAETLRVAFPTITRHVRELQRSGHLAVDPDPDDGRGYRIVLTDAGAAMLRDFEDGLVTRFAPVVQGWDRAELAGLADGLHRLAAAMTKTRQARSAQEGATSWWRTRQPAKGGQK